MNSQSCGRARAFSENSACEIERAGLTEVFVRGIEIRWMSVSVNPIARPPKAPLACLLSVTPRITIRNTNVSTLVTCSDVSAAEEITVAVGCERADRHSGGFGDAEQDSGGGNSTEDLCAPVPQHLFRTHASVHKHAQADSGVKMCTADVTDTVGGCYNRQTERNSYAQKADMTEQGSSATAQNQYCCPEELRSELVT